MLSFALRKEVGGAEEDRTPDLLRARQALSQLSYGPRDQVGRTAFSFHENTYRLRNLERVPRFVLRKAVGGSGWI